MKSVKAERQDQARYYVVPLLLGLIGAIVAMLYSYARGALLVRVATGGLFGLAFWWAIAAFVVWSMRPSWRRAAPLAIAGLLAALVAGGYLFMSYATGEYLGYIDLDSASRSLAVRPTDRSTEATVSRSAGFSSPTEPPAVARPTVSPRPGTPGADLVMSYLPGPGATGKYTDPKKALGNPDLVESPCCTGMVQLGRGGTLVLGFTDNSIVDGYGPDFQVFGESARDDYLLVEVSVDGHNWYTYSKVTESPGGLDLADVGLQQAVYVSLTDVQPATRTGAEIDAVVALNSGPGPAHTLPTMVPPTPKPTDTPEATAATREQVATAMPAVDTGADADAAFIAVLESCLLVLEDISAFESNVGVHIDDNCSYMRQAKPVYERMSTCLWELPKPNDQRLQSARAYYQSAFNSSLKAINLALDICAGVSTAQGRDVNTLFDDSLQAWLSGNRSMAAYAPKPTVAVTTTPKPVTKLVTPTPRPMIGPVAPTSRPVVKPTVPRSAHTKAIVTRIVDGDTIEVAIDGQTYPLRYIGIDTPERGQFGGSEATEANRQLVAGKTVFLEKDVSETDRYGRLLRYVYLPNGTFVNAELVSLGVAIAKDYPPDSKYRRLLASRQQRAVDKQLGIWSPHRPPPPHSAGATARPATPTSASPRPHRTSTAAKSPTAVSASLVATHTASTVITMASVASASDYVRGGPACIGPVRCAAREVERWGPSR